MSWLDNLVFDFKLHGASRALDPSQVVNRYIEALLAMRA
jgi:hypothetical protein|tara:strand:+ start:534 stop:650 length:117 start_codon:yes stop_codon:yes gene_type:complete